MLKHHRSFKKNHIYNLYSLYVACVRLPTDGARPKKSPLVSWEIYFNKRHITKAGVLFIIPPLLEALNSFHLSHIGFLWFLSPPPHPIRHVDPKRIQFPCDCNFLIHIILTKWITKSLSIKRIDIWICILLLTYLLLIDSENIRKHINIV